MGLDDDSGRQEYTYNTMDLLGRWLMPMRAITEPIRCKFCGSPNVVRYGKYRGTQRYLCRKCGRKGADNAALPHMHTSPQVIGAALSMFYGGLSLDDISRQLWQIYHTQPSKSSVYGWVVKYSKMAGKLASGVRPNVGRTWVVDETVLNIGGRNVWFWDIIDERTRFLIASHLSTTRSTNDAATIMRRAQARAGVSPEFIISDKLAAYIDGIERVFGADTWHMQSQGFRGRVNTNLIERFHGTLKSRTKVMRGIHNMETARVLLAGWLVHYNFFRPHESLGGRTPAQAAGVRFSFGSWLDVAKRGGKL